MNGQCWCRESRIATNMTFLQRLDASGLADWSTSSPVVSDVLGLVS